MYINLPLSRLINKRKQEELKYNRQKLIKCNNQNTTLNEIKTDINYSSIGVYATQNSIDEIYEEGNNINNNSLHQENNVTNEVINININENNTTETISFNSPQLITTPQRINNSIFEKIQQEWDYQNPCEFCGYIALKSIRSRERYKICYIYTTKHIDY